MISTRMVSARKRHRSVWAAFAHAVTVAVPELVEAEAAAAAPTAEKSVHKVAAEAAIEANRAVAESGGDGGGDDELASVRTATLAWTSVQCADLRTCRQWLA